MSQDDETWRSIETAPKDGSWVITWDGSADPDLAVGLARFYPVPKLHPDGWQPSITHWMPLPPPPAELASLRQAPAPDVEGVEKELRLHMNGTQGAGVVIPRTFAYRILATLAPRSDRQELVEALRPFAKALDDWGDEPEHPDRMDTWEHPIAMNITLGDFRRARALLSKEPSDG